MKNYISLPTLVISLISLNFVFSASSSLSSHASTFTFRLLDEPATLDWNKAHTPVETYILMNLMEGLVTYNSKMEIVPALAKNWKISPDGKTYTFSLRDDVKWSDGVKLNAQDFLFSWKRLLTPTTAASYAYFLFDIEGAEDFYKGKTKDFGQVGIKVIDELTLQVKVREPLAHWIHIPSFWVTFPLREDRLKKYGNEWDKPGSMVSLGPYTLVSHDIDSKIVLKANPYYYGKRGNIDQVVGMIVRDASTALTLYETKKLDFVNDIPTIDLIRVQKRSDVKVFPYLKTGYLGFVTTSFPLSNVHVRKAIGLAIDRSKISEILQGQQQMAWSYTPPNILGHSKEIGFPYDPEKAKKEFLAAGLDLSKKIKLEVALANWEKSMTLAQFIQAELKKNLGIELILQPFDHKTFRTQLNLKTFPLFLSSWSADYPDPDNFMTMFMSHSGNNRTNWKNSNYDSAVLEGRRTLNKKTRELLYFKIQKLLQEEHAVMIPLYYEPNITLVNPKFTGVELNALNYLLLKNVNIKP